MEPLLIANNIQKSFLTPIKHDIIKNVSLKIYKGEIISIHGSSGSGKSTFLYTISTLDTNFKGELIINGELMHNKNSIYLSSFRNRYIGFIYQFHHLLNDFTVLENVMLPALKLNLKNKLSIKNEAIALLKEVGLHSKINHPTTKLSGGEQQRVAIARALINNPLIVFADEPTGNLDYKNSQHIFKMLKEICKNRNTSMLIVSHDPIIYKNTDRSFIMKEGVLENS